MVKLYARQMQLEMAGKESSAKILLDVMKDGDLEDKRLAKKAADMEVARIKKNKGQFQPTTSTDTAMKASTSQEVSTQPQCITCMKECENRSEGDISWLGSHWFDNDVSLWHMVAYYRLFLCMEATYHDDIKKGWLSWFFMA